MPGPVSRGMAPRPRIVKARTAKQRAAAERVKTYAAQYTVLPVSRGPETSWWANVSREELQLRARGEQARMSTSRFGKVVGSGAL